MKLTLIIFVAFITQITFSQKKTTDLEKMNLKGEVSSIKIIVDKLPSISTEDSDFKTNCLNIIYTFNENGYITKEEYITKDKLVYKTKNYYNNLNQVSKSETYDNDGILEVDENYEYDINGEKNKIIRSSDTTSYRNELELNGFTKKIIQFKLNDQKLEEKTFERIENENGKIIEDNSYEGNTLFIKNLFSYNKKGLLSRKIFNQYYDGKVYSNIQEYLYNDNDDIIKFTIFDKNNKIIDEENNTYAYDIKGNWITKHSKKSTIITTKRNIEYK